VRFQKVFVAELSILLAECEFLRLNMGKDLESYICCKITRACLYYQQPLVSKMIRGSTEPRVSPLAWLCLAGFDTCGNSQQPELSSEQNFSFTSASFRYIACTRHTKLSPPKPQERRSVIILYQAVVRQTCPTTDWPGCVINWRVQRDSPNLTLTPVSLTR
jgi:hypothetical protein